MTDRDEERAVLSMNFSKTHSQQLAQVDGKIEEILNQYSEHPLNSPLRYALRGGKRLRPLVLLLVNDALGRGEEDPLPAASAVEILHTISLIHDDFIDNASERRKMKPYYMQFGLESAFLAADFALGIVLSISSGYKDQRIGMELAKTTIEMSGGEEQERNILSSGRKVTFSEYLSILEMKTASLFRASAKIGALLSKRPEMAERMAKFGIEIGMAYQLRDDLADMDKKGELSSLLDGYDSEENKIKRIEDEAARRLGIALKELKGLEDSYSLRKLTALLTDYF
ncbi:MAG: polyprenyl synthetase family protein [Conexivisphaerales archaeon]